VESKPDLPMNMKFSYGQKSQHLIRFFMLTKKTASTLEAMLLQEKAFQVAVNNALMTIKDRDALCREIADQINQLVPFSNFGLCVGSDSGQLFYTISLHKAAGEPYEILSWPALAEKLGIPQEVFHTETSALWEEKPGIRSGEDFEYLCRKYVIYQALQTHYGCRAALRLRLPMKNGMPASLCLLSPQPDGFAQANQDQIQLILPQISLALENLFAFEEIAVREQVKTAELAIVNAFTNSYPYPEIIRQVAVALNEIIPCDLLSVYRAGMKLEASVIYATVIKKEGSFIPISLSDLLPRPQDEPYWREMLDEVTGLFLFGQPKFNVGEDHLQLANQNEITRLYNDTLGLQSSMFVPVEINGKTIASLILGSKRAYAFTQKDLALLQQVSLQIALGVENRVAFERIEALSQQLELEETYLSEEIKTTHHFEEIIGTSSLLLSVFKSISQVAPTNYTVLILGETGTGKELVARAVHNRSSRRGKALVKVNCTTLPPQLIESELFGHEKGSFTGATDKRVGKFELAHGGTIFLDEIGELPLELQPKLLRVLQEKEIERIGGKGTIPCDVRIIAASNRHLPEEVAAGRFRADLFYRLNVFPIQLPPLRERKEDIQPLATYFLQKIAKNLGKKLTGLSEASLQQMQAYHWPGNIRELEHLLERAAIMSTSPVVSLAETLVGDPLTIPTAVQLPAVVKAHDQAERENILAALEQAHYRIRGKGGAAELLHVKPTTLEARIARIGIQRNQ
jgi:formate hydrogenlyase transcriptional activator